MTISNTRPDNSAPQLDGSYSSFGALVSTTHGVQLNRSFFVGAGVGINIVNDASLFFPIYAAARWELNISSKVTPFVSCKLGICFGSRDQANSVDFTTPSGSLDNFSPQSKYSFLYYQPTVGVRFRLHHHIGLNLGLTLLPTAYEFEYNGEWPSFSCTNLGFNIGIDF